MPGTFAFSEQMSESLYRCTISFYLCNVEVLLIDEFEHSVSTVDSDDNFGRYRLIPQRKHRGGTRILFLRWNGFVDWLSSIETGILQRQYYRTILNARQTRHATELSPSIWQSRGQTINTNLAKSQLYPIPFAVPNPRQPPAVTTLAPCGQYTEANDSIDSGSRVGLGGSNGER